MRVIFTVPTSQLVPYNLQSSWEVDEYTVVAVSE
jgi:hypothetical protein